MGFVGVQGLGLGLFGGLRLRIGMFFTWGVLAQASSCSNSNIESLLCTMCLLGAQNSSALNTQVFKPMCPPPHSYLQNPTPILHPTTAKIPKQNKLSGAPGPPPNKTLSSALWNPSQVQIPKPRRRRSTDAPPLLLLGCFLGWA